jgi:hypothetical protein
MAGYSDAEVEGSVSQFVKSDVTVTRDALGPTDLGARFNEVLELFSATLIFDPNAIFYLVYLASNRLNKDVLALVDLVDDVLQAIDEMSHRTTDVTRTTLLGDASAALLAVDTILSERSAISSQAFSRYVRSVDEFTRVSLEPNIKQRDAISGLNEIIRPPQKARSEVRTTLSTLSDGYQDMVTTLEQVTKMLTELNSLNLAVLSIQNSVRRSRTDLRELQEIFEDSTTTRDDKIAETRDAYLRIISGKAVLNNYTTVTDPQDPRIQSSATVKGLLAAPVGDQGELLPAAAEGARSAPWIVETGTNDELKVEEDGNAEQTYTLVPGAEPAVESFGISSTYDIHPASKAALTGSNTGPFVIPAGPDNVFAVLVDGVLFSGPLTVGAAVATATIVTDILAIPGLSAVLAVTNSGGAVKLEHLLTGEHNITIGEDDPSTAADVNTPLGFTSGQFNTGQAANDLLEIDGAAPRVQLTAGSARTPVQLAADITTWITTNFPSVYTAVDNGTKVKVTKTKPGAQSIQMTASDPTDRPTILSAYRTIGFFEGQEESTDALSATEAEDDINTVDKIVASSVVTEFESGTNGSSIATTTFQLPSGTIDLSVSHVGDTLLIRNGPNAGPYRISGVFLGDSVTLDSATPMPSVGATDQSWVILRERLVLTSKATTLSTLLVLNAASANTELGFTAGSYFGTTTGFRAKDNGTDIDFSQFDVVVGDILRLTIGVTTTEHEILELSSSNKQLEVTPPLSIDPANLTNLTFSVISASARAHEQFQVAVAAWDTLRAASDFSDDISELERVMNPLLANKQPSLSQTNDAKSAANSLKSLLTGSSPDGLVEVLTSFEVSSVGRIDASLKMLLERGLDRAFDTLMDGKVAEFFGFDKDDASTASYMLKTMRQVVQSDLRISKLEEDVDDIIHDDLVVDTDADYDFSDADEDEGFDILGEVAEFEEDDPAELGVSRTRY